jgi:hypothetical protein
MTGFHAPRLLRAAACFAQDGQNVKQIAVVVRLAQLSNQFVPLLRHQVDIAGPRWWYGNVADG